LLVARSPELAARFIFRGKGWTRDQAKPSLTVVDECSSKRGLTVSSL